ncbi:citrate transporter [Cellulomonas triticagri]|uniref:Citrate transporter n=1 Tax=Cellulomonas triticagri TaxID=2483352 RepID=A0A3M2JBU0_9CELL|nr:citrate transporter [Cellulomonas triticagri]RMI09290.1 citrate transporter [Cellulomonas triticagri]
MVWYCVKGYNLMVGFFVMATLWTTLTLVGHAVSPNEQIQNLADPTTLGVLTHVFATGPANFAASILVNVFFGAFFGRVLVETGIAATLIRKVVELGGDRPRLTMSLICVVTAVIFMVMTGIGPVISIAVIVLPIFLSLGISAPVALFAFLGSIMAGIVANMVNFTQYQGIYAAADPAVMDYHFSDYFPIALTGMVIALVVVIGLANVLMGRSRTYAMSASAPAASATTVDAPWYSWLAIVLPILGVLLLELPIILGFILSAVYALLTTGRLRGGYAAVCRLFAKLFSDGAVDVAPMVGFLLMLAMFNNAAGFAAPYFTSLIGGVIPTTPLAIAIVFAVLVPLGFFRGPTNLVGSGAAILPVVLVAIQAANGSLPGVAFMFPMFAILTIVPQHLDITQSWVAWGLGYSKVPARDFMKKAIPTGYVVGAVLVAVVYVWQRSAF